VVPRTSAAQPSQPHCIQRSTKYEPLLENVSSTRQLTADACQVSCGLVRGCAKFTFMTDTLECRYAAEGATAAPDYRAESGPAACPAAPAPTAGEKAPDRCGDELPLSGFPGTVGADSDSGWPTGRQPKKLECWPKDPVTESPMQCKEVAVIQDSSNGWPGTCLELYKQEDIGEPCDRHCLDVPTCQGFQIAVSPEGGWQCWEGMGESCYVRPGFKPIRAQRFQHGQVRVLMDLKGWQIQGLHRVFDVRADGYFDTDEEAAEHCRLACYSDITCDFWTYSIWHGCWVEDVNFATVEYPLTLSSATRDTQFAGSNIAGEYIQHLCPSAEPSSQEPVDALPAPFCALDGYKLEPLNRPGHGVTTTANSLQCQELCRMADDCEHFTWLKREGTCHLQGADAFLVPAESSVAGPGSCPPTTPSPMAQCDLHPKCVNMSFTGLCCPNLDRVVMDCCSSDVSAAGAVQALGEQGDEPTGDYFQIVGAAMPEARSFDAPAPEQTPQHGGASWLLVPLLLLLCLVAALWFAGQKGRLSAQGSTSRAPRIFDAMPTADQSEDMQPLVGDVEAHDGGRTMERALPFPEAGLPSNRHLPFPEAGLPERAGRRGR